MNRVVWNNVLFNEDDAKLIYVDQDITSLPDAIVNLYHSRVRKLDLSFNQLMSLNGLEFFSQLDELILDNNQLGDHIRIPKRRSIKTLSLNNNKITNLTILLIKLSTFLPDIEFLSLLGNPVCLNEFYATKKEYQKYRYYVISALPSLKFLDSSRVTNLERQKADEMSVVEESRFLKFFDLKNLFKSFNNTDQMVCTRWYQIVFVGQESTKEYTRNVNTNTLVIIQKEIDSYQIKICSNRRIIKYLVKY